MVKVYFVHSRKEDCDEYYEVQIDDDQKHKVVESWAFLICKFVKELLLLLVFIETKEFLTALHEQKKRN